MRALLTDACARVVAARRVVVDAPRGEAAEFCARHGLRRIPGTLRLVRQVSAPSRDPQE